MIHLFINKNDQIIFAFPAESKKPRLDAIQYIDKSHNKDEIKVIVVDDSEYINVENIIRNKRDDKEKLYYKNGSIVKV